MNQYSVQTILNPDENFFREKFQSFFKEQIESRRADPLFKIENYDHSRFTSFEYLVRSGRFSSGGISWVEESTSGKVLALSGFYRIQNILVAGVRTLLDIGKGHRLFGIHAKLVLPRQISFAQEMGLCAVVVTFNENNFRILDFIERNHSRIEALSVYQGFFTIPRTVLFNKTVQKILWLPLDKNINNLQIINILESFN